MVAASTTRLDELAHHLFDVVTRFCLAVPRGRRRSGDLKEIEFLTLSLLHKREKLIVGDIQRQLGVLPAQMSRIIRALETRDRPLIACRINPQDKRKIDVALTPAGMAAFQEYQAARVRTISSLLNHLGDDDLNDLQRLIGKLQAALDGRPLEGR
jgi:DNA-binding MarR family transcriptional regulator